MQLQHAICVIYLCNMYVMRLHILEFTENTLKGLFQHRYINFLNTVILEVGLVSFAFLSSC